MITLSQSEEIVLESFRQFHMRPNKMLCFYGNDLEAKSPALDSLVEKELLVREKFAGAYSLTESGYTEMRRPA